MYKIRILTVGRESKPPLEAEIATYVVRLTGQLQIDWIYLKDNRQLLRHLDKVSCLIALDEKGKRMGSQEFADDLFHALEKGKSRLSFAIGGAEGLPDEIKEQAPCWSLSKMTFPHQICRLLLVEQIYRAFEIKKGSAYHKA